MAKAGTPKCFDRLIGIRRWGLMQASLQTLEEDLRLKQDLPLRGGGPAANFLNRTTSRNGWPSLVESALWLFRTTHVDMDLHEKATSIREKLWTAKSKVTQKRWQAWDFSESEPALTQEDADSLQRESEHWAGLVSVCLRSCNTFIVYCEAVAAAEKKNTWGSCELALYLGGKHMEARTAAQAYKELGAMTIEDLRSISAPEIYGDVTVNYDGLSLSVADKNALDLIRLDTLK
jgi:hypothetical protein